MTADHLTQIDRAMNSRIAELNLPFKARAYFNEREQWVRVEAPHTVESIDGIARLTQCFDLLDPRLPKPGDTDAVRKKTAHWPTISPFSIRTFQNQGQRAEVTMHADAIFAGVKFYFYMTLSPTPLAVSHTPMAHDHWYWSPDVTMPKEFVRVTYGSCTRFGIAPGVDDTKTMLHVSYYAPADFDVLGFLVDAARKEPA